MNTDLILQILVLIVGLYMAWNIGANDVSNAMGTSVGSKALSLKQAVILAAILEFAGAFLLGSNVSETIQQGIVKPQVFHLDPMIFVLGMIGSLLATGIWLNLASFLRLPVSTTHAIVGAIAGFGLIIGGMHAINWMKILSIALSWVISPLFSGVIAYCIFRIIQHKILYALVPVEATKKLMPIFVFFVFSIFTICLIFEGMKRLHLNLSFPLSLIISVFVGIIASIITFLLSKKITATSCRTKLSPHPLHVIGLQKAAKHLQRINHISSGDTHEKTLKILKDISSLSKTVKEESEFSHLSSDYLKIEKAFVYLQVMSASLVAFAHGANDVANAIGPVAAVYNSLKSHSISQFALIPPWILLLGGGGIVIGLATWGWRVIETIGKKITELTPTRGFSAEFAAAITILLASKLGMPISTTHALVGAILGVGLARGISAINLRMVKDIALSWVITIPVCIFISIVMFYILKVIFV